MESVELVEGLISIFSEYRNGDESRGSSGSEELWLPLNPRVREGMESQVKVTAESLELFT